MVVQRCHKGRLSALSGASKHHGITDVVSYPTPDDGLVG
jgi:hypothetical protein